MLDNHWEKAVEEDLSHKTKDYQWQATNGLWLLRESVRQSRTVSQTTEPWWDQFWVREPRTVRWLRIQGTWLDFRVRQSRTLEEVKTLHHPWLQLLRQSPKLLSAQHSRAHWRGTKPNTPANKVKPLDTKPNRQCTWEPQPSITLKH